MGKLRINSAQAGLVLLFCMIHWLAGCDGRPGGSAALTEKGEGCMTQHGEIQSKAARKLPVILVDDGTEIPCQADGDVTESVWVLEGSTVHIDFGTDEPDDVTAILTRAYSGGYYFVHDPVPVQLAKENSARYTLRLPRAKVPVMFNVYRYDIMALYGDAACRYQFAILLEPAPTAP